MQEEHYEYKLRGNTLSFKSDLQERFTRCSRKNFGWYYEPEQIRKRIERQIKKRSAKIAKDNGLYQVKDESAVGLSRWAMVQNMQIAADALSVLTKYGVNTIDELEEKIDERYKEQFETSQKLNDCDKDIKEKHELLKNVNNYLENESVYKEYKQSRNKNKFYESHRREIAVFEYSERWLRKNISGNVIPSPKRLEKELAAMESEREELLRKYKEHKNVVIEMNKAHDTLENYLSLVNETEQQEHNEQTQEQTKKRAVDIS